ncbi:hypothetical protein [Slackia heliotrinireducens]|uniref:Uncharacterized protein n=1 Tax=Slackia heliotrinireducens (strain ATCC 29202 / DSM 20476 / NCTC 11029 / RHS 1) TaxID=471855 RepID=C7N339_SLAHD|nr:hypothetical protein [Slackia heliotrinireducens]ACV21560.1 hypothetical protein Shel_05000 [Slackia heliotrinireducens DSM 20476]
MTAESTQVDFTLANLPENALAFVKSFAPDEEVAYGNGENLAVFSPYNGSAPAEGARGRSRIPVGCSQGVCGI